MGKLKFYRILNTIINDLKYYKKLLPDWIVRVIMVAEQKTARTVDQ